MSKVNTRGSQGHTRPSQLAALFALLASHARREILLTLARRPATRQTLAESLGLSASGIDRHLERLRDHDLVVAEGVGRRLSYRLGRSATAVLGRGKATVRVCAPDGSQVTLVTTVRERAGHGESWKNLTRR